MAEEMGMPEGMTEEQIDAMEDAAGTAAEEAYTAAIEGGADPSAAAPRSVPSIETLANGNTSPVLTSLTVPATVPASPHTASSTAASSTTPSSCAKIARGIANINEYRKNWFFIYYSLMCLFFD